MSRDIEKDQGVTASQAIVLVNLRRAIFRSRLRQLRRGKQDKLSRALAEYRLGLQSA